MILIRRVPRGLWLVLFLARRHSAFDIYRNIVGTTSLTTMRHDRGGRPKSVHLPTRTHAPSTCGFPTVICHITPEIYPPHLTDLLQTAYLSFVGSFFCHALPGNVLFFQTNFRFRNGSFSSVFTYFCSGTAVRSRKHKLFCDDFYC